MTDNERKSTALAGRDSNGRFASGSGNIGRPKGSRNRVSQKAMQEIKNMSFDALRVLKENLDRNDTKAAIFVLEKILPNQRTVELDGADVGSIVSALIDGTVSPDEARTISMSIARLKEIDEMDVLEERLAQIEELLKG
ncbi:hypothetical protein [Pseudosulfitobacter koreensis]|uniref:Class II flagellar assembly regulator n=1 Tax=Pseudosulfitobacter koreensis TaxID=2968472 RepID=A0ABT1Z3A7_9RHOB|nr:hypothetical protein [Pseudosulfitobacter koreense]MCR8827621.1 hypothetical protein [Pseudosulfitobacter koreense]